MGVGVGARLYDDQFEAVEATGGRTKSGLYKAQRTQLMERCATDVESDYVCGLSKEALSLIPERSMFIDIATSVHVTV